MIASNRKDTSKSQKLASFVLSYRTTSYSTTSTTPAELFMNRMWRTRLDLIHPDEEHSVNTAQGLQRANYHKKAKVVRFVLGSI